MRGHKTGGRQIGTPNKITTAFKDAIRFVYEDIGDNAPFIADNERAAVRYSPALFKLIRDRRQ